MKGGFETRRGGGGGGDRPRERGGGGAASPPGSPSPGTGASPQHQGLAATAAPAHGPAFHAAFLDSLCCRIPRGPVQQPLEDRIFTPTVSAVYSTVTQVARQPGPPAPSPYTAHEINKGHPNLAATPPGHASSPGLSQAPYPSGQNAAPTTLVYPQAPQTMNTQPQTRSPVHFIIEFRMCFMQGQTKDQTQAILCSSTRSPVASGLCSQLLESGDMMASHHHISRLHQPREQESCASCPSVSGYLQVAHNPLVPSQPSSLFKPSRTVPIHCTENWKRRKVLEQSPVYRSLAGRGWIKYCIECTDFASLLKARGAVAASARPLEVQSSGFSVPPRTAAFAIQAASCLLPVSITPIAGIAKLQLGKENKIRVLQHC
ncbi:hypothetical protein IHE44_0007787 [Lamprotornis superbus]|uniref:Uncharacterized protein n=1 Tax=Lamprotornis superbus TaxID=245042 RepID=A0A835TU09_9PASS|nr:hypothetical protein IHE44_0007787 [Lamprotornis superbus]